jgi:hypothetical protein
MRSYGIGRSRFTAGAIFALVAALVPFFVQPALCQDKESNRSSDAPILDSVTRYLNMANQGIPIAFKPLNQSERNSIFAKSLINPIWYAKGAISAGFNQWNDLPWEWEQGASGYGKRYADIMGQYVIKNTAVFGLESLLHEDNRYFGSGKKGFWPRTGYALSSGILARHDSGKRYPSASLLIGYGSGAYLSRFWQPASANSVGDAAVSFGISMGWNIGFGVVKEFLPDMLRPIFKKRQKGNPVPEPQQQKENAS